MTLEEAKKLASIFETADGGCPSCIRDICRQANEAELGFKFAFDEDEDHVLVESPIPLEQS
jgi:hypothetical protein